MYRSVVIVRIKSCPFFGAKAGDLIAVAVQPAANLDLISSPNQDEDCVICTTKLRPENTPMGLSGMTWREFFRWFEIVAFTDCYQKGKWPQGWSENEGTIYWR